MTILEHVLKSFKDGLENDFQSALMNACFAIDGSAQKYFLKEKVGRSEYKKFIRDHYWIIEPMLGGGLNLEETKWQNLNIDNGNGEIIKEPDFADIVYHIFRCSNAHGKGIPLNFEFTEDIDGKHTWRISNDYIAMPKKVIWALISVVVFSKVNNNIQTNTGYELTWGSESLGIGTYKFPLQVYFGEEDVLKKVFY